jgi:hypothetical protein
MSWLAPLRAIAEFYRFLIFAGFLTGRRPPMFYSETFACSS